MRKILIADDEQSIRMLVKKILNRNYIILEADNGKRAVDMAQNEKPDLVLMDLMMPEMDGNTACYTLKTNQTTSEIPVVMLTVVGYELNKKLSKDVMGADGYMTKPFNPYELRDIIRNLLPCL